MGLFDKKTCDICGEKIGLLGNRKLDDGNICKDCANKLSPWFTGRKKSTVEGIKEQLAYREENKAQIPNFNVSKTIGKDWKVLIDAAAGKFILTRSNNWRNENPDIIDLAAVTGVQIDVSESRSEEKHKDKDGNDVSFVPPHYNYSYSVNEIVNVNHPYFSEMRFTIDNGIDISAIGSMTPRLENNAEYQNAMAQANEIKAALEGGAEAANAAPVVKQAVKCPWCGATTTPTDAGCCEYCGGAINQ